MEIKEKIREAKRRFMAMRNGIVADALRSSGLPYRIIFGLNLPQLAEIADETGPDRELAEALWANVTTRESLMLAPLIFPPDDISPETAASMLESSPSVEVTDILVHSLLRKQPFAHVLILNYASHPNDMLRYGAMRLLASTWRTDPTRAKELAMAEASRQCAMTRIVAMNILDDMEFSGLC